MSDSFWTDERVAIMRVGWGKGLSYTEIGEELGFDESGKEGRLTVGSKIYRLREAAKKRKDHKEVKFWSRGKKQSDKTKKPRTSGGKGRGRAGSKDLATSKYAPLPRDKVAALIASVPMAPSNVRGSITQSDAFSGTGESADILRALASLYPK